MSWKRILSAGAVILLIVSLSVAAVGAGAADSQSEEILFDVTVIDTNEPVAEGEKLEITAEITNMDNASDSQQIHLKNADSEILNSVASPPVTLDPGESERVTLTWDLEKGDAGTHDLRVHSNYDSDGLSVHFEESVFFDVSISETNAPMTAGERLNVTANVTSTEHVTETADVWIELDNESVADRQSLELGPGEMKQLEFSWDTTQSDAGEGTLAAVTTGERDATTVSIDEPSTSSSSGWTTPVNVLERDSAQFGGTDSTMVPGSDVERITFENETVVGRVVVDRLRDAPEDAEPIDDHVGYYNIDVPNVATEYSATIEFTLDADSFGEAGTDSVSVLVWSGEEWDELDTETTIDDEVTVTAKTHGFSLFAVTTDNETDASVSGANESDTETSEANETSADPETSTDTSTPESETESTDSESSDDEAPGFGLVISVLALLMTALLGKRQLQSE